MCRIIVVIAASILFCLSTSCSSSTNCSQEKYYKIDYFTGGGFTGMERGLTIECSGWVKFWERKLNSNKEVLDSLRLESSQIVKFDEIINDSKLFDYKMKKISNHTATLIISKKDKINIVSYNSSEIPSDLPTSLKAILFEIEKINNNK